MPKDLSLHKLLSALPSRDTMYDAIASAFQKMNLAFCGHKYISCNDGKDLPMI
jgi:hypothetical protein